MMNTFPLEIPINPNRNIQEEFGKAFNNDGVELLCSCSYFNNYVCDFTFHAKGINQINTHDFTIVGDIVEVDEDVIPVSLRRRVLPSSRQNVTLVYNVTQRSINYSAKKAGLSIEPDDNGTSGWRTILGINVIIELHNLGCISDEDFDYFVEKFYNFCTQSGDTSKFK